MVHVGARMYQVVAWGSFTVLYVPYLLYRFLLTIVRNSPKMNKRNCIKLQRHVYQL